MVSDTFYSRNFSVPITIMTSQTYPLPTLHNSTAPPAPPPSPILPPESDLNPIFTPAAIMTSTNHLLPEKLYTNTGHPAAHLHASHPPRRALLEDIPRAISPAPAPSIVEQVYPGEARPLIRKSSAHVFINLARPAPVATQWEILPLLDTPGQTIMQAPLLPASSDTMLNAGEGYVIKEANTGKVLCQHTEIPSSGTSTRADQL